MLNASQSSKTRLKDNDEVEMMYTGTSNEGYQNNGEDDCDVDDLDDKGVDIAYQDGTDFDVVTSPESGRETSASSVNFLEEVEEVLEKSCCVRVLRSIWRTRLTEESGDRDRYVKTTLRELCLYLGFVIILCIMTSSMTSSTMYYFTKNTKELFMDDELTSSYHTTETFWKYTQENLLGGLFWEEHYNGKKVEKDHMGYIYFENKILGVPRLRQLRVRNDTCTVHADMKKYFKKCFSSYSASNEERKPFGKYGKRKTDPAWQYHTEDELGGTSIRGELQTYRGGGYTQLLGNTSVTAAKTLHDLKKNHWIDRGTRAVFIEFTIYNANINLFCIVTIMFEFPETGGVHVYSNFNTLRMLRYVTNWDMVVLALEIIFIVYLLYYSVEEIMEIAIVKLDYIKNGWNVFDILIIIMGYMTVAFYIYVHFETTSIIKTLVNQTEAHFPNFSTLGSHQKEANELMAVFILLAWIKIFKYINFNKTMMHLQSTLSRCAKDVVAFAVMFLIIFIAFASWGNVIFGSALKTYSSMPNSMVNQLVDIVHMFGESKFIEDEWSWDKVVRLSKLNIVRHEFDPQWCKQIQCFRITLFRLILGDFDFNEMNDVRPYMGPIFFVLYVFFIFFVLINMFLAIINDTYAEVKEDIEEQETEFALGDYFMKNFQKMKERYSKKKKTIVDIQTALLEADTNQDNQVDYEEWRSKLKGMGHADFEIECVFAKYDTDCDHVLNATEIKMMQEDLERDKEKVEEQEEEVEKEIEEDIAVKKKRFKSIPFKKFSVLNRRVDRLEHSTGSILSKVEMVLKKMKEMDSGVIQRRETMAKIFDGISELSDGAGSSSGGFNVIQGMENLIRSELGKWDKWDAEINGEDEYNKGSQLEGCAY